MKHIDISSCYFFLIFITDKLDFPFFITAHLALINFYMHDFKHYISFTRPLILLNNSIMYGLYNRTDFYLLMDKLSQPNMAASSGLSRKMFSLQLWNF